MSAEILYGDLLFATTKWQMLHQLFLKLSGDILSRKKCKSAFHLLLDGPSNLHHSREAQLLILYYYEARDKLG